MRVRAQSNANEVVVVVHHQLMDRVIIALPCENSRAIHRLLLSDREDEPHTKKNEFWGKFQLNDSLDAEFFTAQLCVETN